MYCDLSAWMSKKLWRALRSFRSLTRLKVWESTFKHDDFLQIPSVRSLTVGTMRRSKEYSNIITSLPNLDELVVECCPHRDELSTVIADITKALGTTTCKLRHLLLSGSNGRLLSQCLKDFANMLASKRPTLEKLELYDIIADEKDLIEFLKIARNIKSLQAIM